MKHFKFGENWKNFSSLIDKERLIEAEKSYQEPPILAGSLNDWKCVPMYRIQDLCFMMDKEFEHPFETMKREKLCGQKYVQ